MCAFNIAIPTMPQKVSLWFCRNSTTVLIIFMTISNLIFTAVVLPLNAIAICLLSEFLSKFSPPLLLSFARSNRIFNFSIPGIYKRGRFAVPPLPFFSTGHLSWLIAILDFSWTWRKNQCKSHFVGDFGGWVLENSFGNLGAGEMCLEVTSYFT